MSELQSRIVDVVTDGSGDATAYSSVASGKIQSVRYVKDGSASFTDGVDFTITTEAGGENVWVDTNINASEIVHPRGATHDSVGAPILYAVGGSPVTDSICMVNDRIKVVVAAGGAAKLGRFIIVIGG
jgi:hypothetical protein